MVTLWRVFWWGRDRVCGVFSFSAGFVGSSWRGDALDASHVTFISGLDNGFGTIGDFFQLVILFSRPREYDVGGSMFIVFFVSYRVSTPIVPCFGGISYGASFRVPSAPGGPSFSNTLLHFSLPLDYNACALVVLPSTTVFFV